MVKIFVAGAVSDYDDPFAWQKNVVSDDHTVTNAYQSHDFDGNVYKYPGKVMEPALSEVREADVLLVRWEDDVFLPGAVTYMKEADDNDIPIVVWYEGTRDNLQIPVEWMAKTIRSDKTTAVRVAIALAGDESAISPPPT